MNTANILGSHLNPQQSRLYHSFSSPRKRWIWSQQDDHLQVLAARVSADVLAGNPVVVWYDEKNSVDELLKQFPLYQLERHIYFSGRPNERLGEALQIHAGAEGIHHIELYKLSGDFDNLIRPWASLHEELWPGTNRYDLIQKFAGLFNHTSVNPLFFKLNRAQFEISPAEYKRLRNKIEHYIKLSKLRQDGFEYLDLLDVSLLINHSLDFVKSEVMQYVALISDQATEMLKRADWIMLRYFNYVKSYWIQEITGYVARIDKLLAHAQELSLTFGDAFSFESSMSQLADKFKGQISRKTKLISQQRKEVKTQYLELLAEIESGQPWTAVPAEWKDSPSLPNAIIYLNTLRSTLLGAKDAIETHIRSQLKRLNSHNAPDHTGLANELREWEEDLHKWYNAVNVSGYFKKRFESQALSVLRSAENLRDINQSLTALLERQHHLEDYFFWAGFHGQFPDNANVIVQSLHLVSQKDWLTYFDEWYITQLITGDALEVEWPGMTGEDIKLMIELLRHHTLAEFDNEMNRRRAQLCEEHVQEIRKLKSTREANRDQSISEFFGEMSFSDRANWFPFQILHISTMPAREALPANMKNFVLLQGKDPGLDLQWQSLQESGCDIYACVPPVNQRFINEKLDMPRMITDFKIGQNRSTTALKYLSNIARQFSPFLNTCCIYSAHRVSIISLLGAELDRLVLDQLPMPYKISERSLNPDENFMVEALLEANKPFVLLLRDLWPEGAWPNNCLWHVQFKADLENIGIRIIHSWSKGWLMEPDAEVTRIREEILQHVGLTFTGLQTV